MWPTSAAVPRPSHGLPARGAPPPGGPPAEPRLAVEDDPAADPGAPEDAEQRAVRLRGADLELGVDGEDDIAAERDGRGERAVVPERRGRPDLALERPAQVERPAPLGQVPRARHGAGVVVDAARRA